MRIKILLVLSALSIQFVTPAIAGSIAQSPRSITTTTGNWAAVAYGQGLAPTAGAYTILWTVAQGKARDFFSIRNMGNFTITGFSASVTQSQTSNSGKPPNTSFDWCKDGIWNSTANTCSGTIVPMGVASDVTLVINFASLNLTVGSEISMRATTQPNLQNAYSSTLSVSVARSHVRGGIVTNS